MIGESAWYHGASSLAPFCTAKVITRAVCERAQYL